jgi:hypothetical protein
MLVQSQKIVVVFGAWAIAAIALLSLSDNMDYGLLYALDLLGLLLIVQILSPYMIRPRWRSMLNVAMLVGVAIFCLLVINKALNLLGMHLV